MTESSSIQRIGLLGGSFNPAHDGHVHISRLALEHLALDQVWWLVSPQNPLKPEMGMAAFEERLSSARSMASGDSRILVRDDENRLGTRFTSETLPILLSKHPEARFIWVIGADNLEQMEYWENWSSIFQTVPIAVFARPPYDSSVLASTAATRFADYRQEESRGAELADMEPPAWVYFDTPLNTESATQIRARCKPENAPG